MTKEILNVRIGATTYAALLRLAKVQHRRQLTATVDELMVLGLKATEHGREALRHAEAH